MRAVLSMALKDLRLLALDKGALFFVFFFPLLYAIFFGYIAAGMGGDGDNGTPAIRIVLVDEDDSEGSQSFAASLESAEELRVDRAESREVGADLVREGKRAALVVIPEGFGERGQSFFMGDPPVVEVGADPARAAERGMLQGILLKYGAQRMQEAFTNTDVMRRNAEQAMADLENSSDMPPLVRAALRGFLGNVTNLATQLEVAGVTEDDIASSDAGAGFEPLSVESIDLFSTESDEESDMSPFAISFPQGVIWGIMGAAAGFAISLVTERTHGTLIRLRLAPVTQRHILAGKAVACFATTVFVAVTLLIIGRIGFGVTPTSPALLAVAVLCVAVCFVGVMMLLSVLGRTEAAASGIGWASLIVMAMIGGGMIPLVFIERIPFLAAVSNASPVKWSILAIEGAIWRGFSPAQMALPCLVLVGVGIGAFMVGGLIFQRTEQG